VSPAVPPHDPGTSPRERHTAVAGQPDVTGDELRSSHEATASVEDAETLQPREATSNDASSDDELLTWRLAEDRLEHERALQQN
jgi:hypothetical protein